jgi:hypothetical protein
LQSYDRDLNVGATKSECPFDSAVGNPDRAMGVFAGKGSTPHGCEPQLVAKSGLDYLDAPPLRDDAAISYDCEVEVEVQCQARAWSERG